MTIPPLPTVHIDLTMSQWDDKRFFFNAVDSDNVPLDLSGFSEITFIISQSVTTAILLSKTLTGATISTTAGGIFYLDISSAESGALPTGVLYCEAKLVATSGDQQTVAVGHFRNLDTLIGD